VTGGILASRLTLCGPGRAGKALERSWIAAGGSPPQVLGRVRTRAGQIAPCDILVLAVPDDAIRDAAAALAPRAEAKFAFHLSGALPASLLSPLARGGAGAALGSLHPLRAFTGGAGETWNGAFVAVEGDSAAVAAGLEIAAALGAVGHRLDASGKALYHAGAQLAAGGTAAVVSMAARIWAEAGLDPELARESLAALSAGAAAAVSGLPFAQAISGAVARRDVGTIGAHVEALAGHADVLEVYARLAEETLARTPGRGREADIRALLGRRLGS
jgi:predicted short-subunit dehydrogenase-like oxidoreductase (DUF2520 family)